MNPKIDAYIADGCGRCPRYKTDDCSVVPYRDILSELRELLFECGLNEEHKWSHPCYTYNNANVILLGAFRTHCSINFIKGSLLSDPENLLEEIGENTQHGRWIKFTDMKKFEENKDAIRSYIFEAIEVEKSGVKLKYKDVSDYEIPEELSEKLNEDMSFQSAWESLTPGRKKSWLLFFGKAKQTKTRISRIEKATSKIFEGKGWNER